jgi:hypothetical protein
MKNRKKEHEEKLYPIIYNGVVYNSEDDVDSVFACFYHSKYSLNGEMGVYIGDDIWIYPDGEMGEY